MTSLTLNMVIDLSFTLHFLVAELDAMLRAERRDKLDQVAHFLLAKVARADEQRHETVAVDVRDHAPVLVERVHEQNLPVTGGELHAVPRKLAGYVREKRPHLGVLV